MKSVREKKMLETKPKTHYRHFTVGTTRISKAFAFLEQGLGLLTKMLFKKWNLEGRHTLWYNCFMSISWNGLLPEFLLKFCLQWPLFCGKIKRALKSQIKEKKLKKTCLWLLEKSAHWYHLLQFVKTCRIKSSEKPQW